MDTVAQQPLLQIGAKSGPLAAREIIEQLFHALSPYSLDPDDLGTIEIVVAEVVNNIVEHAYAPETLGAPIRLRATCDEDGLHLTFMDEGRPMPGGEAPEVKQHDLDVDLMDLPEGGFGWGLVRDMASDVEYARIGWENRLYLRFPLEVDAL